MNKHLVLICDDVYTTGTSFKEFIKDDYKDEEVIKWVAFARSPTTDNVNALSGGGVFHENNSRILPTRNVDAKS